MYKNVFMDHLHFYNVKNMNTGCVYNVSMFQGAADEIVIQLENILTKNCRQFDIPVKEKSGFSWKATKSALWCSSGNAADILKLFNEFSAFGLASVKTLIFDNPRRIMQL